MSCEGAISYASPPGPESQRPLPQSGVRRGASPVHQPGVRRRLPDAGVRQSMCAIGSPAGQRSRRVVQRDVRKRDAPGSQALVQRAPSPPRRGPLAAPLPHRPPSLPARTPQPDHYETASETPPTTLAPAARVQDSGSRPEADRPPRTAHGDIRPASSRDTQHLSMRACQSEGRYSHPGALRAAAGRRRCGRSGRASS